MWRNQAFAQVSMMSGLRRPHPSPRSRRISPGTAREETKWAWDIHRIFLIRRQGENFGFYIRGGKEHGLGIFVSGLDKGGHAHKHGLKIGDRLLRVNDTDFRSIEHQVAVRVIQSATRLVIYVTSTHITNLPEWLLRDPDKVDSPPKPRMKAGPKLPAKQLVKIIPDEDGYLGCSIRGGSDMAIEVCVSDVDAMSPAHRAGLRRGDIIKKVNGMEVKGMTHMQVVSLATAFAELFVDVERRDHRKMSLPTTGAFLQGELAARQINARGRRYSGPDLSVTKPNMAVAIRSACSFDDFEKDEKFGQSVFSNIGDAMTDGDHDPVKSTKLISRTIRLNLNTSTKSGRPCEFQDSPKSMKRCSRPDVRKVFKDIQQFTQLSPSCSPQGSLRGSPRGSLKGSNSHDLHRWNSPVSSPKRGSYASASAMNIAPGTWMDNF